MSDNVTPIFDNPQEPKKNPLKKQWILFFCILGVILVLLVLILFFCTHAMDGVKRYFRYLGTDEATYANIKFDSYGNSDSVLIGNRLAIATQDSFTVYKENGEALQNLNISFSDPVLDVAGKYVLLSDVGGKRLILMDRDGKICFNLETSGIIYDADLTSDGSCAVLYEGTDYFAALDVYNADGGLLYSHHSESTFLNSCALSPDGSLALVTTLGQEDIGFHSSGRVLTTRSEGILSEFSFGTQVIFDAAFLKNDVICAVGENSLFFFDPQGKLISEYQEENAGLVSYCFDEDHIFAVYDLFETGNGCRICSLSPDGQVTCSVDIPLIPVDIHAYGDYLSVLDAEQLVIYDQELTPCHETVNSGYDTALVRRDGTAICLGGGCAELYIP